MYLYNVAYFAQNIKNISRINYAAVLIYADSLYEAIGYGLEHAKQRLPIGEWNNHDVAAYQVDDAVILTAYAKMKKRFDHDNE